MGNKNNNTWVKLYRSILEHEAFINDPTAFTVFVTLLLLVDRKTGTYTYGRQQLGKITGLKPETARKAVERLERAGAVTRTLPERYQNSTRSVTSPYSQIHICNWDFYQNDDTRSDTRTLPERYQNVTTKQDKEKEKEVSNDTVDSESRKKIFYDLVDALGGTERVRYTDQRSQKLGTRLKTYSADELRSAAEVIGSDPFMQGDNEGGKRYGNIDYLLRNDEIPDRWLESDGAKKEVDLTQVEVEV